MVERLSPLEPAYRLGSHGRFEDGVGVILSETRPGSIVQIAAWPGEERQAIAAIRKVTGLALPDGAGGGVVNGAKAVFGFAPGKFTVVDEEEGLAAAFAKAMTPAIGTVTDLSHGRTAIRIEGPEAEWVLAKFFALDFALPAFPVGAARSTTITTSSPRSSGLAATGSTSMSSAPSRAPSGKRSAMRPRKSVTR